MSQEQDPKTTDYEKDSEEENTKEENTEEESVTDGGDSSACW